MEDGPINPATRTTAGTRNLADFLGLVAAAMVTVGTLMVAATWRSPTQPDWAAMVIGSLVLGCGVRLAVTAAARLARADRQDRP